MIHNTPLDNLPSPENPVGLDLEINLLQDLLFGSLPWLEYSFGRALLGRKSQASEANYLSPLVYRGGSEYYDASPNDFVMSQSFFYVDGDHRPVDYQVGEQLTMAVPVSIIFWGNMLKIKNSLNITEADNIIAHLLLQDIYTVLSENDTRNFKLLRVVDNSREVFNEFSVRNKNERLFYYPYFCYRIKGEITYHQDCV